MGVTDENYAHSEEKCGHRKILWDFVCFCE